MVKVRTSQIPEDSPIKKITHKSKEFDEEDNDEFYDLLDDLNEENKTYFKTLIAFPEIGRVINSSYIQSIEKKFRIKESSINFEAESNAEYGIIINSGITPGLNSLKGDIELWYKNEEYRDKRYEELLKKFDEIGIKVITI